jgi:HEAT repeat protein
MAKLMTLSFKQCMQRMRKHNAQLQEDGFHALLPRAGEFVPELLQEFELEQDHGLRCWILELLSEARDERAVPLFLEQLTSVDEQLRGGALRGLRQLDTHEARKVLQNTQTHSYQKQ